MSCGLVSNLATLTIVRILRVQTHFSIFAFFKKNGKNAQKINRNNTRKTKATNDPRVDPKTSKKAKILTLEGPEISKIAEKSCFLRCRFFGDFCRAKEMQKMRQKRPGRRKRRSARRNVRGAWEDYRRVLERLQGRKQEPGALS